MKRIFTLIVGLMLIMTAFAQKTVAVYVTASDGVPRETKRILGSELVAAITKTADYVAVERTADFMAQVAKEQGNYEIDDAALYDLGRKFGASNVCVADVTKFGDEYYIVARLLDIKTSKVWKTAKNYSTLKSLRELVETSEALSNDLFGSTKELSTYAYGDNVDNNSYIIKIENRGNFTKVIMKYVSIDPNQTLGINRATYIEDIVTHQKYNLTDAVNINIIDQNNSVGKHVGKGIWEYSLFFERLSDDAQNIMIIEPNGRKYKDIIIKPYGKENTFVFEDNTQNKYNNMLEHIDEWKQQHDKKQILAKRGRSYYLDDKMLSKREYKNFIRECPEAWANYRSGKTWNTIGWISLCVGIVPMATNYFGPEYFSPTDIAIIGVTGLCGSITSFIISNRKKNNICYEYNNHCAKPATLSMGITSNGGVGLTLNF